MQDHPDLRDASQRGLHFGRLRTRRTHRRRGLAWAQCGLRGALRRGGPSRPAVRVRRRAVVDLETPGHTDDSISIAFAHLESGEAPIGVFTGDALFFGDVGRTDFYPDRAREVAGLLYDSLHDKLLALGDQVLLYPAHGSGSVCGSGIAKRDFSSIGYERGTNPRLQMDREAFIAAKVAEHHYVPPYFKRMEAANAGDKPGLARLPAPAALGTDRVDEALEAGAQLLDLRPAQAIASACVEPAVSIPLDMLASFGGWFLDYGKPIVLLLENEGDLEGAVRTLVRIGYDRIDGFVAGGINAWATAGRPLERVKGVDVHRLKELLDSDEPPLLLDVRSIDEFESGCIQGAEHHYVGQIESAAYVLATDRPIVTYCASGMRALVAAAALVRLGRPDVSVCWGSMEGWKAAGYPVVEGNGS